MKKNLKLTELCKKEMARVVGGDHPHCHCGCGCYCPEGEAPQSYTQNADSMQSNDNNRLGKLVGQARD